MSKSTLAAFLMIITISGLTLAGSLRLGEGQSGTTVTGIITSNTTWTKLNSPYSLTGPVAVNTGVTLTIEAGATVNLGSFSIQVNGTLIARGTNSEQIHFNGGSIDFTSVSNSWNDHTGSGCIIENSFLSSNTILVQNASLKINNNTLNNSPIQNNQGSPIISNNSLFDGGISSSGYRGIPIITNNTISSGEYGIELDGGNASISDNSIYGCQWGIRLVTVEVFDGSFPPYPIVERNLIINNTQGIGIFLDSRFGFGTTPPIILNNTISKNSIGLDLSETNYVSPTLSNNNILGNTQYNIYLESGTINNMNATYNWWGTTDTQEINQSIHDSKNDFNLGAVNFVPFLNKPNPEANPQLIPFLDTTPTPTQSPAPNATPSTSIPEFPLWTPLTLLLVVTAIAGTLMLIVNRGKR